MKLSEMLVALLTLAGCAVCGWLCLFRTNVVVTWARAKYAKSKLIRAYPFSGLVLQPWYPNYLRCMGVFVWLFGAAVPSVLIVTVGHR